MQQALVKADGVYAVKADGALGTARIAYDPTKTDPKQLAQYLDAETRYGARAK